MNLERRRPLPPKTATLMATFLALASCTPVTPPFDKISTAACRYSEGVAAPLVAIGQAETLRKKFPTITQDLREIADKRRGDVKFVASEFLTDKYHKLAGVLDRGRLEGFEDDNTRYFLQDDLERFVTVTDGDNSFLMTVCNTYEDSRLAESLLEVNVRLAPGQSIPPEKLEEVILSVFDIPTIKAKKWQRVKHHYAEGLEIDALQASGKDVIRREFKVAADVLGRVKLWVNHRSYLGFSE